MDFTTNTNSDGRSKPVFSRIRKHFTFANVAVTLAMFFAISGGAYAASKYLITSTKQISPKVLKALQGKAGPAGKAGLTGPQGPAGLTGPAGKEGTPGKEGPIGKGEKGERGELGPEGKAGTTGFTETLPPGKTEKGDWSVGEQRAADGVLLTAVSFNIPLESAPIPIYVKHGAPAPTHCTGSVSEPGAEPGYLCVFAGEEIKMVGGGEIEPGLFTPKICSTHKEQLGSSCTFSKADPAAADPTGFMLTALAEETGLAYGTWAVTAPE